MAATDDNNEDSFDDNSLEDTFDSSNGEQQEEDTFSDLSHLRASFAQFDPSIAQSLKNEFARVEEVERDPGQEEDDLLANAVAKVQTVTGERPSAKSKSKSRRRRSSMLNKTLFKTFTSEEETTVLKVLAKIDSIQEHQCRQGFKEVNFTAGLANSFFVAYAFGRYPEHFWLVYLIESFYFIPSKFLNMIRAKPLNEAFYYLDFCWMMNFTVILGLLWVISPLPISEAARCNVALGALGIACGPLLGATAILPFVAFVFHDLNTMTNVVIHALPPMFFYTFRWHAKEIRQTWPSIFHLTCLESPDFYPPDKGIFFLPGTGLGSIAGNTIFIYMLWFIPYVSWMLLIGMNLPRKNNKPTGSVPVYDTVFHSFWRVGACQSAGTMLWKRPIAVSQKQMLEDDYEVRDFLAYIGMHAFLVLLSIPTLAFACNYNKHVHVALIMAVLLIVIHRGSQRYTYYTTKMYSRVIRKEFLDKTAK